MCDLITSCMQEREVAPGPGGAPGIKCRGKCPLNTYYNLAVAQKYHVIHIRRVSDSERFYFVYFSYYRNAKAALILRIRADPNCL